MKTKNMTITYKKITSLLFLLSLSLSGYSQQIKDDTTKLPPANAADELKSPPLTWVQEMPQYPGGDKELINYISQHVVYPKYARMHRIQGRVTVRFVVDVDGAVKDAHVSEGMGIGGGCDEEAVRVINSLPRWKPGKQNGENVPVWYTVPIVFKLAK
jgi:periplasmic protein TonB